MGTLAHENGSCIVKKNEMVTLEGERSLSLKLLLQGKLDVYISASTQDPPATYEDLSLKSYKLFELDENMFISVGDLVQSCVESLSIAAADDCSLFVYGTNTVEDFWSVIHENKDYGAYVVNSICHLLSNSYSVFVKAHSYDHSLKSIFESLSCKQLIESDSEDPSEAFTIDNRLSDKIKYYLHIYDLPSDIKKSFFTSDRYITSYHIIDASLCLNRIISELRRTFASVNENIKLLYGDKEEGAYFTFAKTAIDLKSKGLDYSSAREAFIRVYDKLNEISEYLKSEYNHDINIDFKYLNHIHNSFLSSLDSEALNGSSSIQSGIQRVPEELINSAARIIEYSEISEDKASIFMLNLNAFINLRDKHSTDEDARRIRRAVCDVYFDIYKAVFKKAYDSKDTSRLIKMFITFGYMDERLLDADQVNALYKLAGMENTVCVPNVYYADEWFTKIYDMGKDPSINSFGQDYFDVFREMKKQGKVSDKDLPSYSNDMDARLSFEISHMLHTNHKLCQNQLHGYFPILHKDAAPYNPIQSLVTPEIVKEKLDRILSIDFSAFHREISYRNPSLNIEKELVMISIVPDIIFIPVYGSRASMWQDLTGRVRTSPGRFIIPVFTDGDLDDMLIKLVGNFRWELCRTMAGSAWNDVSQSSLTSDYSDYIQFYRKNRDLSTEAKEKIKSSVAKYHNKTRDIFTSDYEIWINNESKANPRLNKIARGIFSKHCPFGKEIREQLERQPIYADMFSVINIQREKHAKSLAQRYSRYLKTNNGVLDPVLEDNLKFYTDM